MRNNLEDMQSQYPTDGEIFTNVDNYNSTRRYLYTIKTKLLDMGWGQNQTGNVSVNIYNSSPYWVRNTTVHGLLQLMGMGLEQWLVGDPYYWGWNSWYGGYYGGTWGLE